MVEKSTIFIINMLKILSFHILLEICLNIIFTGFHIGFSKPITEKKRFLGKLMSSILYQHEQKTHGSLADR